MELRGFVHPMPSSGQCYLNDVCKLPISANEPPSLSLDWDLVGSGYAMLTDCNYYLDAMIRSLLRKVNEAVADQDVCLIRPEPLLWSKSFFYPVVAPPNNWIFSLCNWRGKCECITWERVWLPTVENPDYQFLHIGPLIAKLEEESSQISKRRGPEVDRQKEDRQRRRFRQHAFASC